MKLLCSTRHARALFARCGDALPDNAAAVTAPSRRDCTVLQLIQLIVLVNQLPLL